MGLLTDLLGDGNGTSGLAVAKIVGGWVAPVSPANTTGLSNGFAYAVPVSLRSGTLDRIGIEVTTAGGAGSVIRLGIYEANSNGYPSSLLVDAGTVDATSTGDKELTISEVVGGGTYWLVAAAQGSATAPSVRGNSAGMVPATSIANQAAAQALSEGSVSGALSATWTTTLASTFRSPRVAVRYGA